MYGFKVLKGPNLDKAILDSTWPDLKRAKARQTALQKSTRKSRRTSGARVQVWVLPIEEGDPFNYRRPKQSRGY